jgi:hypothetical protein
VEDGVAVLIVRETPSIVDDQADLVWKRKRSV